jgi:hypothetical protein
MQAQKMCLPLASAIEHNAIPAGMLATNPKPCVQVFTASCEAFSFVQILAILRYELFLKFALVWNPLFLKAHCNREFVDRDCPALIEVDGFLPYNRRIGQVSDQTNPVLQHPLALAVPVSF